MIRPLVLGLVLATGTVAGQTRPAAKQATAPAQASPVVVVQDQPQTSAPPVTPPTTKDPFQNLSQSPSPQGQEALPGLLEQLTDKTRVVCGLTMVEVDPKTDRKIMRSVPAAAQAPNTTTQPDFKIRRIIPTICRD